MSGRLRKVIGKLNFLVLRRFLNNLLYYYGLVSIDLFHLNHHGRALPFIPKFALLSFLKDL